MTHIYTLTDTHNKARAHPTLMHAQSDECSKAHTLISVLIRLTMSRMLQYITFKSHGSLSSQINILMCTDVMNVEGGSVWNYVIIKSIYLMKRAFQCLQKVLLYMCLYVCASGVKWYLFVAKLTRSIFSSELEGSRACVLRGIFVFLGVQILPLRDRGPTSPSVSGVCSALDHVHQVQGTN